jgi:hypothetical protein
MLIDDLLSQPLLPRYADLRGRLSKAPKFMLAPDFAIAADQLGLVLQDAPDKIAPALCRLPYPECWIEVAQADRLSARATLPPRRDQVVAKKRIGYLLTHTNNDGAFAAQLMLSLVGQAAPIICPLALRFDPHAANLEAAGCFQQLHDPAAALSFWHGEPRYLAAVLALLHSRNACATSIVEFTRLNRQRARHHKPLLFSYHLVAIPARYKQRHVGSGDDEPSGQEIRAHWCRGHLKIRRTGVFFWSAHQRGNMALGFAHKDYLLRGHAELQP